jgi:cyanate permease
VAAIGTSVGGIVIPKLMAEGIALYGWRDALEWLAVAVLVLMLPAVMILVRGKPEDVGLEPEADPAAGEIPVQELQLTTVQILRMSSFWFLSLSLGLLFSSYSSMVANLGPYALDRGYDESTASTLIMLVAASGFVGKLVFGAMADKVNLKLALNAAQALVLIGFLLLALEPAYMLVLGAIVCIGLAAGGMLPVWGALIARVFGLLSYGRVMGMMGPVITLCVMPGYAAVGRIYDVSGSYVPALIFFAGVLVVSILLLLPMKMGQGEQS